MSNESSTEDLSRVSLSDAGVSLMALCLGIIISSANATTIVAIWRTPALRTLANMYVCSLACADFFVGLTCVLVALFLLPPVKLTLFYKHIHVCFLFHGVGLGPMVISAFHMMLIAFDRYIYIMRPYFYQRVITVRVISGFIGSTWVLGVFMTFICQFIGRPYDEVPICDVTQRQPIWYTFYLIGIIYTLTSGSTVIAYVAILRAAARQRNAVRAINVNLAQPSERAGSIDKGTMKSIKFFVSVFGAFFCCITPNIIILGLDYFIAFPAIIYRLLNLLGYSNSAMNFIIYAVMNKDFRQAYLKTLCLSRCDRNDHKVCAP
ncbi:beta-4C adrenergic receptor [Elysia marginata]|uniref:Beta-4C adrenergic receptor n=1 Tax=Elysia marginata TaxID=1093978 RepID=A0AAV4GF31_9GAST|nr:beta-4C adrenergic receptor [Elysia marginata]